MKISVKLDRNVLIIQLDSTRSFSGQVEDVRNHLDSMKSFLAKSDVKVDYSGVELTFEEEMELCSIADSVFEKEVEFCHRQKPPHSLLRHIMTNGERVARRVVGTVRAGSLVESNGDLIVIGDVNPTAQLQAGGDIYVIGNLRGIAHAGCSGEGNAVIYAMGMNPVLVKIGDKIGFNPEPGSNNANGIAMITDGEIKIKLL